MIPWLVLLHIFGVILWVAGLLSTTLLLSTVGGAEQPVKDKIIEIAAKLERTLALPGFALAFIFGMVLFLGNAMGHSPIKQGWMHMKLTVVFLGLIPIQGLLGARRGKLRKGGDAEKLAGGFRVMFGATLVLTLLALFLIEAKPTNKALLPDQQQSSWFFDALGNPK